MECCTTRKRCFPTWYGSAIYLFVIIVKTYYSIECAILLLLYRHHQKPNKINSFKRVAVSTRCYTFEIFLLMLLPMLCWLYHTINKAIIPEQTI